MQQIREVNSQIMPSLPVFCELKPREELSASRSVMEMAFSAGAMIQLGEYQIYIGDSVTEKMLSTILSVIQHA